MSKPLSITQERRPIKFRAWDKTFKKMFNVIAILFDHQAVYFDELVESNAYKAMTRELVSTQMTNRSASLNDVVLMEFTGETDRNGRPIFEGDVVQFYSTTSIKGERYSALRKEKTKVVQWNAKQNGVGFNIGSSNPNIEVIGNIYENPELEEE